MRWWRRGLRRRRKISGKFNENMKTGELNDRQMVFARELARGRSSTEAYKAAYGEGRSEAAVWAAASRLLRNVKVAEKVEELRREADSEAIVGRKEILERLSAQFRKADEEGDRSGMVKVVGEINKMTGGYEPERVQVEGEWTIARMLREIDEESTR